MVRSAIVPAAVPSVRHKSTPLWRNRKLPTAKIGPDGTPVATRVMPARAPSVFHRSPPPSALTLTRLPSIFEHAESEPDCLRLLVGRLPASHTGPARPAARSAWPVSRHYARTLAHLAHQRDFDGYLLNVEVALAGGAEQARALAGWIAMLESELRARVGAHAQVVW